MGRFNNEEDDDIVDPEFDEKFGEEIQKMKDQINSQKLSDEFKLKLQKKLDEEYYKFDEKEKSRKLFFPTKMVATFACCFILLSGCATFADEIESWVTKIFSNTDKKVEQAVENGNYKEIDMDYVENNGVSIKVDYVVAEENSLCIAFNVLTEEEFDDIYFENIQIKDENDKIIYDTEKEQDSFNLGITEKNISKNETCLVCKLIAINEEKHPEKNIKIKIGNILIEKMESIKTIEGEWNFELRITE